MCTSLTEMTILLPTRELVNVFLLDNTFNGCLLLTFRFNSEQALNLLVLSASRRSRLQGVAVGYTEAAEGARAVTVPHEIVRFIVGDACDWFLVVDDASELARQNINLANATITARCEHLLAIGLLAAKCARGHHCDRVCVVG